jgi:hypothetical protein
MTDTVVQGITAPLGILKQRIDAMRHAAFDTQAPDGGVTGEPEANSIEHAIASLRASYRASRSWRERAVLYSAIQLLEGL